MTGNSCNEREGIWANELRIMTIGTGDLHVSRNSFHDWDGLDNDVRS